MRKKIFRGVSFVLLAFVFSYVSSIINAEAQMVCYASTGGGGGSGVTDIFGGLTGSVFASATPANNKFLVATSGSAASWVTAPDAAMRFNTGSNTITQAACADLSDGGATALCAKTYSYTTTASASSITPVDATLSTYYVSALAADLTIAAPSGSPTTGDNINIILLDAGVAKNLTYTGSWLKPMQDTAPSITVAGKKMVIGCKYIGANWYIVAYNVEP